MKKRLFKYVIRIVWELFLLSAMVFSFISFFKAELIVDKMNYGFLLTFLLIYINRDDLFGGGNISAT